MKRKELVKILKRFPKDAEITVTVYDRREYVDKVEASVDQSGNWVIHIIGEDNRIGVDSPIVVRKLSEYKRKTEED